MDSVTQFVLGAGVSAAVLGPRIGMRKAVLVGGLLGTLPDLDVYLPSDNAVDSFISHRGASHSLFVHALATPILGEMLRGLFKPLREARWQVWAAVFLCLATHALLDAMTIYGTKLFWPIWPEPVGLGSVFIIDPLYSLPLIGLALVGLFKRGWTPSLARATTIVLAVTTAYLGWSAIGQQAAMAKVRDHLASQGMADRPVALTPTPFNTLFWRAIVIDGSDYHNLYIPLLGGPEDVTAYRHKRLTADTACWLGTARRDDPEIDGLARFSKGFFKLMPEGDAIVYSDLRMGLTPNYVFRFKLAEYNGGGIEAVFPERQQVIRDLDSNLDWLIAGIGGDGSLRLGEKTGQELELASGVGTQVHC